MKISRFKFTPLAIVECVLCIILLPITISVLKSSYASMKYYTNLKEALLSYNGQSIAGAYYAIENANNARPEMPYPNLLKANVLLEKKEYDKAEVLYKTLLAEAYDTETVAISNLGIAICELNAVDSLEPNKKEREYAKIETKMKDVLRNISEQEFPDGLGFLGHLYLKKAEIAQGKDGQSKYERLLKTSSKYFENALKSQKLPSRQTAYSCYLGSAWANYLLGEYNVQNNLVAKNYNEIFQYYENSIENFRQAFLFHRVNPAILNNIQKLYGKLLSFSWLTDQQRENLIKKSLTHIRERNLFRTGLRYININLIKEWQLDENRPVDLYNGLGISHSKLAKYTDAQRYFDKGYDSTKDIEVKKILRFNSNSIKFYAALEDSRSNNSNQASIGRSAIKKMLYEYRDEYKNFDKDWDKKGALQDLNTFIKLNNFLAVNYYTWSLGTEKTVGPIVKKLEKYGQFPNEVFDVNVKEGPVNAERILRHNMVFMYNKLKQTDDVKRIKKYLLHVEKTK